MRGAPEVALQGRFILLALLAGIGCSESQAASATTTTKAETSATCGGKDMPDCPLQGWMKATLKSYLSAKDTTRLATSLELLAEKSPAGYDGWREMSLAGADAARKGDLAAVKAECSRCHDEHRGRFRREQRAVVLF